MELTNAQIALQAAAQTYSGLGGVGTSEVERRASSFLGWLNDHTPEERPQDAR